MLEAGATADGITRLRFVDGWVSERERVGRGLAGKYLVTKIEQGREWWEGTSIHDEEGWRSSGDEEAYRPSSVLKPDDSCWHSDTDEAECVRKQSPHDLIPGDVFHRFPVLSGG